MISLVADDAMTIMTIFFQRCSGSNADKVLTVICDARRAMTNRRARDDKVQTRFLWLLRSNLSKARDLLGVFDRF
jgi:hypothetical protein